MDVEHLRTLIEAKSGESLAERDERALVPIKDLLRHPDVADYLQYCLPRKPYLASGITVNDLTGIIAMMHPKASPGGSIRSYGYVVVGDSVGGNAICFQTTTGRVFWAD